MCDLSPPSSTEFQKQAKVGVGQTDLGTSRWGTMGCGSETRPAEDKSNVPFITRCHARSGKDGGRRAQEQGSKGEAKQGGETKRLEGRGVYGVSRVGESEQRKVTGAPKLDACTAVTCVSPTLSLME